MFTSKSPKINGLLLLAAVVGLLIGSAAPASAGHLTITKWGSNAIGEELGPNASALCSGSGNVLAGAQFDTTYYVITDAGINYQVGESGYAVAHYAGSITMNIQHGMMVAGWQGVGTGMCNPEEVFIPAPVPLTRARVEGSSIVSGTQGNIKCDNDNLANSPGTYSRVGSHFHFDFNVSCTIKGNSYGLNAQRVVWVNFDVFGTRTTHSYLRTTTEYLKGITHSVSLSGNGH